MFENIARVCAIVCTLAILYLSLVPGELRPHSGASGHLEHFMAYAGTAFFYALGTPMRQRIALVLALALLSGLLEIAQLYVPNRTGEWPGFAASSLGALVGFVAGTWALHIRARIWRKG
jgi:VanZ family protein